MMVNELTTPPAAVIVFALPEILLDRNVNVLGSCD